MNSRLRWRSLTRAWTWPLTRSMPASLALIFVVACEGWMHPWFGRQVGRGRCNGLDAWLLVIRNDCDRIVGFSCDCRLLQDFHFAINAQYFGHFLGKVRIAL